MKVHLGRQTRQAQEYPNFTKWEIDYRAETQLKGRRDTSLPRNSYSRHRLWIGNIIEMYTTEILGSGAFQIDFDYGLKFRKAIRKRLWI